MLRDAQIVVRAVPRDTGSIQPCREPWLWPGLPHSGSRHLGMCLFEFCRISGCPFLWLSMFRPRHGRACVDPQNREMKRGEIGALVIKLPLPPGTFLTLWNADERFVASYLSQFPGCYMTADAGYGVYGRGRLCVCHVENGRHN